MGVYHHRTHWLMVVCLLALVALIGVACAPAATPTAVSAAPTAAPKPAAPTSAPVPATSVPAAPQTLFVAWGQKVDNLDPQSARGNRNWWVLAEMYDTLTTLPGQSLEAKPYLAESWTVSADGKEYTFKLRKGVKFVSGNDFNAQAVKFSMDRLQTIGLGPLYMTTGVYNRTEVIDDYTVKMVLNYAYPVWPVIISQPAVLGISDPKVVLEKCGEPKKDQKCDWLSTKGTAGTGAYTIEEFVPNERVVLKKNPNYWQGWQGKDLDRIVWETVLEETTRSLRLEKGDLDIASLGAGSLTELEKRIKDQKLPIAITKTDKSGQPLLSLSTQWININNKILPTSDINVRKALLHSFNYDLFIERVMKGYAIRMDGMVPKGVPGHVDDYPRYNYDLQKAKEFLDKASPEAKAELAKGLRLPYRPDGVITKDGALMWQADLAKLGINLRLEEVDAATLTGIQTSSPGTPLVEARWFADFPDPDNFKNAAWTKYWPGPPTMGYGAAFAGDAKTDDLIDRGKVEGDPAKRKQIYQDLELYFRDQASILMIAQPSGVLNEWSAQATWVKGFEYNPMIHPIYYYMSKEK